MAKLTIVPTPVGNLEDITLRAIRVLKEADLILAEDTRTTGFLLKHFEIQNKMLSHHKFNEHKSVDQLASRIRGRKHRPGFRCRYARHLRSGFMLVRACVEQRSGCRMSARCDSLCPGSCKFGLPCDKFCFEGFLPQKKGRQTRLKELAVEPRTIIFYESPFRLVKTLTQLSEFMGAERKVSVSREISKLHEETVRGTLSEVISHFSMNEPKGEIVIVLAGLNNKMEKEKVNEV